MWSDRKQENLPGRRSADLDNRVQPTPPVRGNAGSPGLAVIGKAMLIKGQITSREDLFVDGEVDGAVDLQDCRLTVGPNGRIGAGARAREVEVMGRVDGDVEATKKITIRTGGRLVGDLRTPGIVIEDGAYFKGRIEIVTTQAQDEPPPAQPEITTTPNGPDARTFATPNATNR
jgi:cytoskeletal protein CcmA (bactofilin family)